MKYDKIVMKKYGYLGLDLIVCSCIASEHEIFTYQFVSDISCSIIGILDIYYISETFTS